MKKLRKLLLILISFVFFIIDLKSAIIVTSVGFYNNPVGIPSEYLFFSWYVNKPIHDYSQIAYQIIISDNYDLISKNIGNIYDSKKIYSSNSIIIPIKSELFLTAKKYFWKVKIWDNKNNIYWSDISSFVLPINLNEWKDAKWIAYEILDDSLKVYPGIHGSGKNLGSKALKRSIIPYFRKEFIIERKVKEAYLFITGLGHYEAYINGKKVGSYLLTPSWTNYKHRVYFNTYEVTDYLDNKNCIGIIVGNGFYYINRERYRKITIAGGYPVVIAKLIIHYLDDSYDEIVTDETWKTTPSPIVFTSIYGGEDYDARIEKKGWNEYGFDDKKWNNVVVNNDLSIEILKPEIIYPVTFKEEFKPINEWKINNNTIIYDFGQNMSAIINIFVQGNIGDQLRITPAELLTNNLEINQKNSGKPYFYTYILKGKQIEFWKPLFSYYGFRYAQVDFLLSDSLVEIFKIDSIKAIHVSNSAPEVGNFSCSNELFNKIFKLIKWAIKSNMQNVLTDCPHREKLGWLEQTYLMGSSIHYNFDVYHLYNKIIYDMMDSQLQNGMIPNIAPEYVIFEDPFRDSPEWGSASIILPYQLFLWYGDTSILKKSWNMMKGYFNYLSKKAVNYILDYGLGDWYDLGPEKPGFSQLTPIALTATATYFYDACILKNVANVIRDNKAYIDYNNICTKIKQAFNNRFFDSIRCIYSTGSQTAMAMPIVLNLVPEKYKDRVIKNFVDLIIKNNYSLTAGDIGFYYVLKALADNGYSEIIYKMNIKDDVPGYGYQIKKGATSLTESWQALETVSNNHLMLGHLMDWFYYSIAGIRQNEGSIAYKDILFQPDFIEEINYVNSFFYSPYGKIISNWNKKDDKVSYHIVIPPNCTATVKLNKKYIAKIMHINNRKHKNINDTKNYFIIKLGSGEYFIELVINK